MLKTNAISCLLIYSTINISFKLEVSVLKIGLLEILNVSKEKEKD